MVQDMYIQRYKKRAKTRFFWKKKFWYCINMRLIERISSLKKKTLFASVMVVILYGKSQAWLLLILRYTVCTYITTCWSGLYHLQVFMYSTCTCTIQYIPLCTNQTGVSLLRFACPCPDAQNCYLHTSGLLRGLKMPNSLPPNLQGTNIVIRSHNLVRNHSIPSRVWL